MNAYLMAVGSVGDVVPLLGLGQALVRQGIRVRFLTFEPFRPLTEAAGLEFVSIGGEAMLRALAANTKLVRGRLRHSQNMANPWITDFFRPTFALLRETTADSPQGALLIGTTLAYPLRCLGELTGWPTVQVSYAPAAFRSILQPSTVGRHEIPKWLPRWMVRLIWWWIDSRRVDPRIAKPLNGCRAELGLSPVHRVYKDWLHSADISLGLFPEWFSGHPKDWPKNTLLASFPRYRSESAELSQDLKEYLAAGPPPVVVSLGTLHGGLRGLYSNLAAVCQGLGYRCLLVTGHSDNLPEMSTPGLKTVPSAPFHLLFPQAAMVVSHGGIGTIAEALAAGVPQLICPIAFDQFDNAARVRRLGVGLSEHASRCSPKVLQERLLALRDPSFGLKAREVAALLEPPDLAMDAAALAIVRMAQRKLQ